MTAAPCLIPKDQIRRILIIKWSALGDVAIASAVMEDIVRAFPSAEVHLNTQPNCIKLFKHDPRFSQVFAIDVRKKGNRLSNALAWISKVRSGGYDLLIDLQRTDRSRFLLMLLWLTGGAPRYRLGNRGGFPYTHQPKNRDPRAHALVMMRSVLESVGIPARTPHPMFYPNKSQLDQVDSLRNEYGLHDGHYVVLLPGSQAAGLLKRWGVARFHELARLLHGRGMEKIVLIGGPDEIEDCKEIAEAGDFVVNLNGLELLQIAPLCKGAAAIVGNDTGIAHFASGAGRPMLVLCGPTDPRRVKPIGEQVIAVQAKLPCINCYAKECSNVNHQACMKAISPEWVASILPALITGDIKAGQSYPNDLHTF